MSVNEEPAETIETTSDIVHDKETITKKDPRKVEQGKRLASISRAAKEKKMREKIENEMRSEESYIYKVPKPLLVGLPFLTVYFLYNRYNKSSEVNKVNEVDVANVANVVSEKSEAVSEKSEIKKVKKKFETLDD